MICIEERVEGTWMARDEFVRSGDEMDRLFHPLLGPLRYAWGFGLFGAPGLRSWGGPEPRMEIRGLPEDLSSRVSEYYALWDDHDARWETNFTLAEAWRVWALWALDRDPGDLGDCDLIELEAVLALHSLGGSLSPRAERLRNLLESICGLLPLARVGDVRLVIWYRSWLEGEERIDGTIE